MAACRVLGRGFIAKKAVEVLLSRCRTARCPGRGHFCHLSQHHPTASHVQPPSYAFWVSHMLGPPTEKNSGESGEVLAFINRQNLAKSSRTFSFIPLWRAGTVSPFRERFRIYMKKKRKCLRDGSVAYASDDGLLALTLGLLSGLCGLALAGRAGDGTRWSTVLHAIRLII